MAEKVIMPQLGESVVEGTVARWLVKEGDLVKELDLLLEISTDKVATEIPSSVSGVVLKILVPEGTTVNAGTTLAWVGQPGEMIPDTDQTKVATASVSVQLQPTAIEAPTQMVEVAGRDLGFISPVVARIAAEYKVDLSRVKGSGEGGRITKKDVLAYTEANKQAPPEAQAWETPGEGDLFRPTEMVVTARQPQATVPLPSTPAADMADGDTLVPLSVVRKAIADHMVLSKASAPHVTTVMEADLQCVVAHREANKPLYAKDGANLTYTAYFVAAAVAALKAYPLVNSSWSDQGVLIHQAINIGVAVSLGADGLIVPVLKNTDQLSLLGIARAVNDLAGRARSRHLKPNEVKDGTFSITNHGISRSLFATPIINQPQVAILGVGAIQKRVIVLAGDALAIRPMVYLSLTFDHRVLDGAVADDFLAKVVESLESWQ